MSERLSRWLFWVVVVLILIFGLQNTETLAVRFLFWHISLPRVVVLFATFGAGVLAGLLLAWEKRRRAQ